MSKKIIFVMLILAVFFIFINCSDSIKLKSTKGQNAVNTQTKKIESDVQKSNKVQNNNTVNSNSGNGGSGSGNTSTGNSGAGNTGSGNVSSGGSGNSGAGGNGNTGNGGNASNDNNGNTGNGGNANNDNNGNTGNGGNANNGNNGNTDNGGNPDNGNKDNAGNPENISFNDIELFFKTGEKYIIPENIKLLAVSYEQDNDGIEIVDGLVIARKPGKSILKVNLKDTDKQISFIFNIEPDSKITIDKKEITILSKMRNENTPDSHIITVTKQTEYTEYKLNDLPYWIMYDKVSDGIKDVYTFKTENDSYFDRSAKIVFMDIQENIIEEIYVSQSGNYNITKTYRWVKGIDEPSPSELTGSGSSSGLYREWPESENTKWFHTVKLAYSDLGRDANDSSLCWAMTGANMLHWWLEQNKENIERYMMKKNIDLNGEDAKAYKGVYNKNVVDEGKSNIAEMARRHLNTGGVGGDVRTFFNWYIVGRDPINQNSIRNYKKAPGYFKDVFNDITLFSMERSVSTKEQLEREINTAFENGEAIAVDYFIERGLVGRHVVTVWGAGYDKAGNLVELWIADSNIGPKPSLQNRGICYKGDYPYFVNLTTTIPSPAPWRIEGVIRLNKGEAYFNQYLEQ